MPDKPTTKPILGSEALSIAAKYRAILDSDDPNDIPAPGDHHAAYREFINTIERLVMSMDALDPRAVAEAEREACLDEVIDTIDSEEPNGGALRRAIVAAIRARGAP